MSDRYLKYIPKILREHGHLIRLIRERIGKRNEMPTIYKNKLMLFLFVLVLTRSCFCFVFQFLSMTKPTSNERLSKALFCALMLDDRFEFT